MSILIVYVACKTPEEAQNIASAVIQKRLAACANVFPEHKALYEWDGAVQDETETAMILKTTAAQFEALKAEILTLHSYEVPCIVAWPIEDGHAPFMEWVAGQVGAKL